MSELEAKYRNRVGVEHHIRLCLNKKTQRDFKSL